MSRRVLLGGLAGAAAAATLGAPAASAGERHGQGRRPGIPERGASLVLLGTKGGPPLDADRAGICSALVVDGAVYLVDVGRSATTQYFRSGLGFADLAGVFVTHLHADHVADYANLFLLGGHMRAVQGDTLPDSTPVYGPGPAGGLPPTHGGGTSPTTSPEDPTPGLLALTDSVMDAYAYHTNYFMRNSGIRETRSLADVREIEPPVGASFEEVAPPMDAVVVHEDDRVRVSAVLVPHGAAYPCFAYRFDTDHGSVTFSGDTSYSANLERMARGSDVLVHEAINVEGWDGPESVRAHLVDGHVEVQQVGGVAQRAEAEHLVLSHLGDLAAEGDLDARQWRRWAQQGYDGRVTVGDDLDVFTLQHTRRRR
ncbi:MBL fold metallo-hydrolase [Isoptericola aurantiacus]|uniref:MBL fold metallo-hydrolase n=1 Tax=Isoptericola aurantiacus TaxID=3377839 RepID=UPI00383A269D